MIGAAKTANREKGTCTPPIRVAINAITELTPKYGARVYLRELAMEMRKLEGVELILLVGSGQSRNLPCELQSAAREVSVPHGRSYWQYFYQGRIRKVLMEERADVYHLPNTLPFFGKCIPTVVTIHDLADLRVKKYGFLRTAYRWAVNYITAHLANRVLTVSENSRNEIHDILRISKGKISVTYNGVSDAFRVLDSAECKTYVKSKYDIEHDFILAPGGLQKNKNIERLLLAFEKLTRTEAGLLLVLTGISQEAYQRTLERAISKLALSGKVIFTGYVPPEDLPVLYNACSVAVYPSLFEGFGLPILESFACGTPLVASNNSSLPEIAGDAAVLVNPYDPDEIAEGITRLLSDENLRQVLVARGLQRVRQFTWENTAQKTLEVYRAVRIRKHDAIK